MAVCTVSILFIYDFAGTESARVAQEQLKHVLCIMHTVHATT